MEKNYLARLQKWYEAHCNGDWEHSYGIRIDTLDNPGWHVEIDLAETCLEDAEINISEDNGTDDWYSIKTEDKQYIGVGDFNKLEFILQTFFDVIFINNINKNFLYDLFIPLIDNKIYRAVYATMINESTFKIEIINDLQYEKTNLQFLTPEDMYNLNVDNIKEDMKYAAGDVVICKLKSFYSRMGLEIAGNA